MVKLLIRLALNAVAVALAAYFVDGMDVYGWGAAVSTALVLGLVNTLVRPFLKLITLPLNILTLGLFSLVVNAICLLITDYFVDGLQVRGFFAAVVGSVLIAVFNAVLHAFEKDE